MITRRVFLASAGAAAAAAEAPVRVPNSILVHEHVLVDFAGAAQVSRSRYEIDEAFRAALPKLAELKPHGCVRFIECTPNFVGRDPRLLRRLHDAIGIDIWTNTGLYGARDHFFLPEYVKTESAGQLARRWIEEAKKGVEGMKPRFVKTAVNNAPLNAIDRKLVEAAALTAKETGVPVASHTGGRGPAAMEQIEIFDRLKCPLSKFVWVHAQSEKDHTFHEKAARAGAWVEFDGINEKSAAWHRECVEHMASRQLLHRTLISQDSGWYRVGEPAGGRFNGFTWIYSGFLPLVDARLWKTLMVDNPRAAFGR